jgi:hypothetical protein
MILVHEGVVQLAVNEGSFAKKFKVKPGYGISPEIGRRDGFER